MRVLIADDHPMVRGALRESLTGLLGGVDIAEAGSFDDIGAALANGNDADLVLLDFPDVEWSEAERLLFPVVMLPAEDSHELDQGSNI